MTARQIPHAEESQEQRSGKCSTCYDTGLIDVGWLTPEYRACPQGCKRPSDLAALEKTTST